MICWKLVSRRPLNLAYLACGLLHGSLINLFMRRTLTEWFKLCEESRGLEFVPGSLVNRRRLIGWKLSEEWIQNESSHLTLPGEISFYSTWPPYHYPKKRKTNFFFLFVNELIFNRSFVLIVFAASPESRIKLTRVVVENLLIH